MSTDAAAEATARKTATTAAKKPATKRPATAKVPQDRKPAATAEAEATKTATMTVSVGGQEWEVPTSVLDDFELLGHLNDLQSGQIASTPIVLQAFLGAAQTAKVMDSLRDPDTGRVPVQAGVDFVYELVGSVNPN